MEVLITILFTTLIIIDIILHVIINRQNKNLKKEYGESNRLQKKIIKQRKKIINLGRDKFTLIREGEKRWVYDNKNELIGVIYD